MLPEHVGRTNFCIDTSLQAYKDSGSGAQPVGGNVRISEFTWDPEQPGQTIDGIDQMACAAHQDPCLSNAFIRDYFGLAISGGNIYALMVSTHYPSAVTADDSGPSTTSSRSWPRCHAQNLGPGTEPAGREAPVHTAGASQAHRSINRDGEAPGASTWTAK